jgi:uncharacterized protein (DUF2141 family)
MRRIFPLPILALMLGACASSGTAETLAMPEGRDDGLADLTIEMSVEILEGDVRVILFKGADAYNGGKPTAQGVKPAAANLTFTVEGIEPGEYGIKAFHDVNGNGELDTNVLGIPNEPFAFSNNAPANFGPAKWEDAAFPVSAPATLHKMEIK